MLQKPITKTHIPLPNNISAKSKRRNSTSKVLVNIFIRRFLAIMNILMSMNVNNAQLMNQEKMIAVKKFSIILLKAFLIFR